MEELDLKNEGNDMMECNQRTLCSDGLVAIVFTAISSVTAVATALLPFFLHA